MSRPDCARIICFGSPTTMARLSAAPAIFRNLALGWCTYGVGDHMSHYNVNASVSKTLIQHLIRFVATSGDVDEKTQRRSCLKILATEISPELVPADANGVIQSTEKMIGPYDATGFQPVLRYPVWLSAVKDRLSRPSRLV